MTLTYKIGAESPTATIDIASFEDFEEFLWSNKVGKDRSDTRIRGFWEEAYRELMSKPMTVSMNFNRYRAEGSSHLVIVEVSNQY